MLLELDIDPMGVSIDSLLLILPEKSANDVLKFIKSFGLSADIVGYVDQCGPNTNLKPGVSLVKDSNDKSEIHSSASAVRKTNRIDLSPKYREEPYTPIKKVTNVKPSDQVAIQSAIENAMKNSLEKKKQLKKWLTSGESD
jgi:hydrogenase expression/formation protein